MNLNGVKILIISPQAWGAMKISKHHYAIEFSKLGADVHFLTGFSQVKECYKKNGVSIYTFKRPFFYLLKFHMYVIYEALLILLPKLANLKRQEWDLVLNFDLAGEFPMKFWKAKKKVFFPVDFPPSELVQKSHNSTDFVVSIAGGILKKFDHLQITKLNIGHGVSSDFEPLLNRPPHYSKNITQVGYAGNLTREDIDFKALSRIVSENKHIQFHLWGAINCAESNLGGGQSKKENERLKNLLNCSNVVIHGTVCAEKLHKGFEEMDAFLICYDPNLDQSKSLNYHKILEYLSTGKVVVSNRVHEYEDSGLLVMSSSYLNNDDLPAKFTEVCAKADHWNSIEMQARRIKVAKAALYKNKVIQLWQFIEMKA